jgi:hypothetical protein
VIRDEKQGPIHPIDYPPRRTLAGDRQGTSEEEDNERLSPESALIKFSTSFHRLFISRC